MQRIEDELVASPLFAGLAPDQVALIAGCGVNDHAAAGVYLFREGEAAERFYLIRQGSIALEVNAPGRGPIVVETLVAGEVAGLSWLFEPYRWQFDGRAAEPVRLVAFDGLCLRGKCESDHELGYQLMRRLAGAAIERLQATRLQLLDVYANPARA